MSNGKYRRYCFTVNNPTPETTPQYLEASMRFLIFGREICPTTGTPHLQGYVEFVHQHRITGIKTLPGFSTAHLEVARGSPDANITYCSKSDANPTRFGTPGPGSGTRTDLVLASEAIVNDPTPKGLREMAREHPDVFVKFHKGFAALADILSPSIPPITAELRPWQRNLADILRGEPHPRKIIFYIDPAGNSGKSFFVRYWCSHYPDDSVVFIRGAQKQMFYNYDGQKYIFFDLTRSDDPDHPNLPYQAMESMKNGFRPNSMYGKRSQFYQTPHIVVMMNEAPDESKLSRDRYQKYILSSGTEPYHVIPDSP